MPKRTLNGTVCSSNSNKTVVVKVERLLKHPIYKKYVKRFKKYHVHDEKNILKVGDKVSIRETRPVSKLKTWEVI